MNKYENWYNQIIENAKARTLDTYVERHHILPKSLGGTDDNDNLVDLTAKEHFICHWLLTKMYTGSDRGKMINALYMMQAESPHQKRYKSKITSRVYQKLREEYAQYISQKNKGRKQPPEEKAKQIAAITGRTRAPFNEEWKLNLSRNHKSKNPNYDTSHSDETRRKIGEKIKGRKQTEEEKNRRRQANLGKKKARLICPHCNKDVAVNTYALWHGDNCKEKQR